MAIYLDRTDTLLLEIPRTGSKWIRAAVAGAGIPHRQVGPGEWRGHGDLAVHGRKFRTIAAFVRDPVTWYASYWARRQERGWRPRYALDRECNSASFDEFVRKSVTIFPGFLGHVYNRYVGTPARPISFIGRQESLSDDLADALRLAGEEFDEARLRAVRPTNISSSRPTLSDEIVDLIVLSEFPVMRRFGYLARHGETPELIQLMEGHPGHVDALRSLGLWTASVHWEPDERRRWAGNPLEAGTSRARLVANFGVYADHVLDEPDMAERMYRRAIAHAPHHTRSLMLAALFLQRRGEMDEAEVLFERAISARPDHAEALGAFAVFLSTMRGEHDRAEALYRAAVASDPRHARNLGNFAVFMEMVRQDVVEAERLYRAALAAEPENQRNLARLARFLEINRPGPPLVST